MRKRGVRDDPRGFPWVIRRAFLPSGAGRWKTLQDDLFKCGCSGKVLPWIQAPLWVGHMVDAMTFNGQLFSSNQPPPPTPRISLGPAALRRSLCWSLAALPSLLYPRSSSLWDFGHKRMLFYVPLEELELEGGVLIMLSLPACPCSLPRA